MSREDWAFPMPKEMRGMAYIEDIWEDSSHVSIDSDDAFMLGFDVPWKMPRKEASPTPPPAFPPPASAQSPCHTPLMNHYTTFYRTSTTDIPASHTAPTPGSPLGLTPHALPPRSLDDTQFDRWINSQASIVDHAKVQEPTVRSSEFRGRSLSFPNPPQHPPPMPPLEPDSADTTISSTGPGTPPPPPACRDINHYNGNPFALADEALVPLPRPSHTDTTLGINQEEGIGSGGFAFITHVADSPTTALPLSRDSASTLHLEVEDLTPTLNTATRRNSKSQRRTHIPALSSPRPTKPAKRAKKASAPEQPPHDIFAIDPTDVAAPSGIAAGEIDRTWAGEGEHRARYGFVMPDTPGPMPLCARAAEIGCEVQEGKGQDQREALDVLASAAARRRQRGSPFRALQGGEGNGLDETGDHVINGDVEGGLDVDNKAWLLDQMDHNPSRASLAFDAPAEYAPPPTFAPPNLASPKEDDYQPTIPSSAIPGNKLHSPTKSSTSDETTESETTPTLNSRTKRRNEREYRRLRRIGIMTDEKADPVEEFSPRPAIRGRSAASRRNGLDNTDSIEVELEGDDAEDNLPRCLLSFGKRVKGLKGGSASIASERIEPFGTTSPSAKEAMERAQASKTLPGSSSQPVQKKKGFNAPRPIAKTDSQVSQVSVGCSENADSKQDQGRKKRKLDVVEDGVDEVDVIETEKAKVAPIQTRLPLATVSTSTNNNFTSISESAKLRRAKTAGPSVLPTPPVSTTSNRQGSVAASGKGKKKGGKIGLVSATSKRSATTAASVQAEVKVKEHVPEEDDDADYVEQPIEVELEQGFGTGKKRMDPVGEENEAENGEGGKGTRGYCEAEISIMLGCWNGTSTLSTTLVQKCVNNLIKAGHKERSVPAIKWYMKNTLWPRFAVKYGLPRVRAGSGQGRAGRSKS